MKNSMLVPTQTRKSGHRGAIVDPLVGAEAASLAARVDGARVGGGEGGVERGPLAALGAETPPPDISTACPTRSPTRRMIVTSLNCPMAHLLPSQHLSPPLHHDQLVLLMSQHLPPPLLHDHLVVPNHHPLSISSKSRCKHGDPMGNSGNWCRKWFLIDAEPTACSDPTTSRRDDPLPPRRWLCDNLLGLTMTLAKP